MIRQIKSEDAQFCINFNKVISPGSVNLVMRKWQSSDIIFSVEHGFQQVSIVGSTEVTTFAFRDLRSGNPLLEDMVEIICTMFQLRDNRIRRVYTEVHELQNNYESFQRSYYLPPKFFANFTAEEFVDEPEKVHEIALQYLGASYNQDVNLNTKYLFIIIELPEWMKLQYQRMADSWVLIIIDVCKHTISIYDPRLDDDVRTVRLSASNAEVVRIMGQQATEIDDNSNVGGFSTFDRNLINFIKQSIHPFLKHVFSTIEEGSWEYQLFQEELISSTTILQNEFDSGMYLFAVIYFKIMEVPIFFSQQSIDRIRVNLAYWILLGQLPF